jgi:hypothetical protein
MKEQAPDAVNVCHASSDNLAFSADNGATGPSKFHWVLFICAIVGSFFLHEIGHCTVAWAHGYAAVPTPAKEYLLSPIPQALENQVALGGILGSVAAVLGTLFWLHRSPGATRSALLAGAMTAPGFYTLRFILFGRGHDADEFQQAQAALGLSYSGHALDWFFAGLMLVAAVFWLLRTHQRLTLRFAGRVFAGAVLALTVLVLLQSVNNAVFDPLLEPRNKDSSHVWMPSESWA